MPGGSSIVILVCGVVDGLFVFETNEGCFVIFTLRDVDKGDPEVDRRDGAARAAMNRPRRNPGCSGDVSEIVRLPSLAGSAAMAVGGALPITDAVWV